MKLTFDIPNRIVDGFCSNYDKDVITLKDKKKLIRRSTIEFWKNEASTFERRQASEQVDETIKEEIDNINIV